MRGGVTWGTTTRHGTRTQHGGGTAASHRARAEMGHMAEKAGREQGETLGARPDMLHMGQRDSPSPAAARACQMISHTGAKNAQTSPMHLTVSSVSPNAPSAHTPKMLADTRAPVMPALSSCEGRPRACDAV
jgi:hypothetical protein